MRNKNLMHNYGDRQAQKRQVSRVVVARARALGALGVSRSSVQTKGKITMQLLFRTAPESANAKWAPILTP